MWDVSSGKQERVIDPQSSRWPFARSRREHKGGLLFGGMQLCGTRQRVISLGSDRVFNIGIQCGLALFVDCNQKRADKNEQPSHYHELRQSLVKDNGGDDQAKERNEVIRETNWDGIDASQNV